MREMSIKQQKSRDTYLKWIRNCRLRVQEKFKEGQAFRTKHGVSGFIVSMRFVSKSENFRVYYILEGELTVNGKRSKIFQKDPRSFLKLVGMEIPPKEFSASGEEV
jgi:hypothetical protein